MAAVSVVLPWSTCPMVPTFTCVFMLPCLGLPALSSPPVAPRRTSSGSRGVINASKATERVLGGLLGLHGDDAFPRDRLLVGRDAVLASEGQDTRLLASS